MRCNSRACRGRLFIVLVVSISCFVGSAVGMDEGANSEKLDTSECEESVTELRLNATVRCKLSANGTFFETLFGWLSRVRGMRSGLCAPV